ncbi:hypothetical protein [Niabella hibiscisoli]|uniref:hypothetical protein n=1 Tax=Niabella hibiscisoli TaxID=1825928 RepID=UPI001F0FA506|nr:hypothetical protein [Niabella hibiscisoli]MCH5719610.1 hypothetical protein [Niabella hibiscisoli]
MRMLTIICLLIVASTTVDGQTPLNGRPYKRLEPGNKAPFNYRMIVDLPYVIDFSVDSNQQTDVGKRYDSILAEDPKLDRNFDFRFQLKQYHLQANFDNVFVLTLKDNKWKAQYFTMDVKPTADNESLNIKFIEQLEIEQSGVDQLWELLVQNNLLNLPSQLNIREKMVEYVIDNTDFQISQKSMYIGDGVLYEFDLQKYGKQRHYQYGEPFTYFKKYLHIKELAYAVVNISLVRKFLK